MAGDDGTPETLEERLRRLEERVRSLEGERSARDEAAAPGVRPARGTSTAVELEAKVGAYWLSRLGIIALITGVAFLVIYKFGELGVALRIAIGYALGGALAVVGRWVGRRHRVFGEVLVGGGLAVGYFVTYALHFVPAVRVVESDLAALALVGAAIVGVVGVAHRMRSETVAGIALFLGLHTGMLADVSAFALLATLLLAAGAVFFLVANRWVVVPISGVVAAYATHARWMLSGSDGGSHALSLGFLSVYFALFTAALLLRPAPLGPRGRVLLPLGNAAGLAVLGAWELRPVESGLFPFLLCVAAAHACVAAVAARRHAELRELAETYLGAALVAAALAWWARLDGVALGVALAGTAATAALAARLRRGESLAWVGLAVLVAGLFHPPLLRPDPVALLALVVAGLVSAEVSRPAAERGWEAGLLGGYACAVALALVRFASAVAPDGYETVAWALAAALLFAAGFARSAARYRYAGFAALALTAARLFVVDLRSLGPDLRIVTFLSLGVLLLGLGFAYTRWRVRAGERKTAPYDPGV